MATKTDTYLLGVTVQASGKAAAYSQSFLNKCQAVEKSRCPSENANLSYSIIDTVSNIMTDRRETNDDVDTQGFKVYYNSGLSWRHGVHRNTYRYSCTKHGDTITV